MVCPSLTFDMSIDANRGFNLKIKKKMVSSVHFDYEPSLLDPHCFYKYMFLVFRDERSKLIDCVGV